MTIWTDVVAAVLVVLSRGDRGRSVTSLIDKWRHRWAGRVNVSTSASGFEGRLDSVDEDIVSGWVLYRRRRDEPWTGGQDIDIFCDEKLVCRARAERIRPDVAIHFSSTAACGFAVRLPSSFCKPHASVDVVAVSGNWRLPGAPLTLSDRDVWMISSEMRAIIPTALGLEKRSIARLALCGSGYAVGYDGGQMATPVPMVLPSAVPYSVQAPDAYEADGKIFLESCAYPKMTIAKLEGAVCLPHGLLVTASGCVIDECFQSRKERTFHHELNISDGFCSLKKPVSIVRRSGARVLWIDHQHMNHYGHFITDVLSKLWAYPLLRDQGLKVLVSDTNQWWIFKILEAYGLNVNDLFILKEPTSFESVYVPTRAMQLYEYASPLFFPIGFAIARVDVEPVEAGMKLYVTRRKQSRRRLVNEDAVEDLFRSHGYAIVVPEEVSIDRQIDLFKSATAVAGCSGSALYSVIYGRQIESLIVLASPDLIIKSEQLLFAHSGRPLWLVVGERLPQHQDYVPGEVHNPWHVDLNQVENALLLSDRTAHASSKYS